MDEIGKLLSKIQADSERFDKSLISSEKKILSQLIGLIKELEVKNGKLNPSVANLKIINKIKNKLGRVIEKSGYLASVKEFTSSFESIAGFQDKYFSRFGPVPPLSELDKQIISSTADRLTDAREIKAEIGDLLRKGIVAGESYSNLVNIITTKVVSSATGEGMLERHAKTYARDALNGFIGERNNMVAARIGAEWFMYVGSNLTTTREFCEHLVKKKYVHVSELPTIVRGEIDGYQVEINPKSKLPRGMIAGTNPQNIVTNRGGYNCGHQLVPVPKEVVPAQLVKKIKAAE